MLIVSRSNFKIHFGEVNTMEKERKRMCLNCKYRQLVGASDFCTYAGKRYMHYAEVFEGWCPHWTKDKTKIKGGCQDDTD